LFREPEVGRVVGLESIRRALFHWWSARLPVAALGAAAVALLLTGADGGGGTQGASPDPMAAARGEALGAVRQDLKSQARILLQQDRQLLAAVAAGHLDAALNPLFTAYHRHVPEFAAWAYQWRTSYALLRRGVVAAIALPFMDSPSAARFGESLDELIAAKFDELVLRPEGGGAALRRARLHWEADVRHIANAVINDTLLTVAMLQGRELPPQSLESTSATRNSDVGEASLLSALGAITGPVKTQAVRPLLTRLTIRPPVAAAVTAAGEALGGVTDLAMVTSVGGMAATVAGFLSIDYLISRADAVVHQADLEQAVNDALDTQQEHLRRVWLATMQAEIDARTSRVAAMLTDLGGEGRLGAGAKRSLARAPHVSLPGP
jgi:hypothetical protein